MTTNGRIVIQLGSAGSTVATRIIDPGDEGSTPMNARRRSQYRSQVTGASTSGYRR